MMKHLQKLLLSLLLVTCPPAKASKYSGVEVRRGLGKEESQTACPVLCCPPIPSSSVPSIPDYSWNRMEGGGEAKTHSVPYMAYLQGKNNRFCGGFLVAPNWVMTAAQCFM